jgi:steroid 5-alpha reductase family enzyme
MTVLYLESLAGIALSLSILMAIAWVVQQRTGNSGRVDTMWASSVGRVAALVAIWSPRPGSHIAARTAGITDDPRDAAFAGEWGVDSPRKMFIFPRNQGFGSIPPVVAIFVAARFPQPVLRIQDAVGGLMAPVFMYWIPVHVTGIPPLEQQMLRARGARYRDYQPRTGMFFPLPPQKGVVT